MDKESMIPVIIKSSPLVESVDKLALLPTIVPSSDLKPLIRKINNLLDLRLKNEMRVLEAIDRGFLDDKGQVSDTALVMHKSAKDSISELVKVKMTLEGLATERKDVVHTFDVNGLLEALRGARDGRIGRVS